MSRLLLLSNSTMPGTPFFTWPKPFIQKFLGSKPGTIIFIPYAAVTFSFDKYEAIVQNAFADVALSISSIHKVQDKLKSINEADAIVVGGGNTFALLQKVYQENLVEAIRQKVKAGTPYIGWSAGANLACPTIMTTNDMPIVQPPSFEALNLIPFQINPHYHELKFEKQGGETRKERLEEFLVMNPTRKVIGLPEGMLLQKENDKLTAQGNGIAKLYQANAKSIDILPNEDVSSLLMSN